MKQIPLTQGEFAIVDDEDYQRLTKYNWYLARDEARTNFGKHNSISMQTLLMKPGKNQIVLHKRKNRLDNRRENLIIGSKGMVNLTRGIQTNNTTGYRGISRYRNGRYIANISSNKKRVFLGYFDSPEQAAQAYNTAALETWGNIAPLNDLGDLTKPKDDPMGRRKAYYRKVELSQRNPVQLGIYKKILKRASERVLEEGVKNKNIED